jgi:hypothetical protein
VDDKDAERTEKWFLERGLPHFIAHYDAATDIWTRALPALTLLFLVELVALAPNRNFAWWVSLLAVVVIFAATIGAWALVNRARGRRPLARPDDIGVYEIAAFVLVPAIVPLVFGGQVAQAVSTTIVNVVLLGLIFLATSYAVIPMLRWGLVRLTHQLEAVVSLLARALPMIALLVTFLFLTVEVWQTAGVLDGAPYWLAVLLFPLVGVTFLAARVPRDIGELNHFDEHAEIARLVEGTPIGATPEARSTGRPASLTAREWGNVALVALFSQGVQIAIVSVIIGGFFVLLGLLLVDAGTTESFAGQVHVLATLSLGQRDLVLTEELLRVAGFLTAFAGLNFTVYLVTDPAYRTEFREEVVGELRQSFAVRAVYRSHLDAPPSASTTTMAHSAPADSA